MLVAYTALPPGELHNHHLLLSVNIHNTTKHNKHTPSPSLSAWWKRQGSRLELLGLCWEFGRVLVDMKPQRSSVVYTAISRCYPNCPPKDAYYRRYYVATNARHLCHGRQPSICFLIFNRFLTDISSIELDYHFLSSSSNQNIACSSTL